jgi:hypothetical protein
VRRATPLLLATVIAAGCGSGGKSYAEKADAVCTNYKQKTEILKRPASLAGLATVAQQTLPLLRSARRELAALDPPENKQATATAWLHQFDVLIRDIEKIRDAAKANDGATVRKIGAVALQHNQHANELAAQLGTKVCSKD